MTITAEELAALRKEGLNDDEILKNYQEFDKSSNGDISELRKSGMKPGEILDGLAEFHAAKKAQPQPAQPETWGESLMKIPKALGYGVGAVAHGLGNTAEATGYTGTANVLKGVSHAVTPDPKNYQKASDQFAWNSPSTYGYAPRALLESAPGAAVDIGAGLVSGAAAGAVTGGTGAFPGFVAGSTAAHTARTYGDNLQDRLHYQGKTLNDATGTDQAIALGTSAAEGAIGALGVKGAGGALTSITKGAGGQAIAQIPGQILRAGVRDGVAGAAGDVVNQTGRTIGTDRGLSIDPDEAMTAGALSGVGGAALRGARGATDVVQSTKLSGMMRDPESATRVADSLQSHELDLTNRDKAQKAIKFSENDIHADNTRVGMDAYLKNADPDTQYAVSRSLDRIKSNEPLTQGQIEDLRARLGGDEVGQRILQNVTDLHTLAQVKAISETKPLAESTVGRLTNPLHKFGAGVEGLAIAAHTIPAVAQFLGAAGHAVPGLGAAVLGTHLSLRAADRVTGSRAPVDQFAQRFSGFSPSEGAPLPQARAPQGPTPDQYAQQTDQAWNQNGRMEARDAAAEAARQRDIERAYATRGQDIDPDLKARQEAAMWRSQEAQEAPQTSRPDWTAQDARDAIQGEYAARDATNRAPVEADAQMRAQAQAQAYLRAQQEAQARAQYEAQNTAEAETSAARQREFEKAQAQVPALSERAKAQQLAEMYRMRDAAQKEQTQPRTWSDADAVEAIRQAETARQAESQRALDTHAIERAAQNPMPVDTTVTEQPKAQTKTKKSTSERARESVKQPKEETDTKASKPEGDFYTHEGIDHPIPSDVKNRGGYIASLKHNQEKINRAVDKAYDDGQIEQQTFEAIKDRVRDLKTARTKTAAQNVVSEILDNVDPADRHNVSRVFNDSFFKIWSKDE